MGVAGALAAACGAFGSGNSDDAGGNGVTSGVTCSGWTAFGPSDSRQRQITRTRPSA